MSAAPRNDRSAGAAGGAPPIAVTMGDPAGIGPDIALMSWLERSRVPVPTFVLYGDPQVLLARARALGARVPIATVPGPREAATQFADALPVMPVPISGAGGDAGIVTAIETAAAAVMGGEALALVTREIDFGTSIAQPVDKAWRVIVEGDKAAYACSPPCFASCATSTRPKRSFRRRSSRRSTIGP